MNSCGLLLTPFTHCEPDHIPFDLSSRDSEVNL